MRNWQPILLGAALAACDSSVHAAGVVRDTRGVGIPGATVVVWRVEQSGAARAHTDSGGHFNLARDGSSRGRVVIQACHPGYAIAQQAWVSEQDIPDSIVLVLSERTATDTVRGC